MVHKRRKSYAAGHRPKLLVVADDSAECNRAVHFGARRAVRLGGVLVIVAIADSGDFQQQWLGVGDVIRAEAEDAAAALIEKYAAQARSLAGIEPERVVRVGITADEILALIEEDEDISYLVLAAGTGSDGPGPLVSTLAVKAAGTFAVPIVIVPGSLSDDEIDALS